jgi:hypothetical protein
VVEVGIAEVEVIELQCAGRSRRRERRRDGRGARP